MAKKVKVQERRGQSHEPMAYRRVELPPVIGLSLRKIDQYLADGTLRSFRRGRCRLVKRDALQEFLSDTAS
jgi:excisionase family DNA binding protein